MALNEEEFSRLRRCAVAYKGDSTDEEYEKDLRDWLEIGLKEEDKSLGKRLSTMFGRVWRVLRPREVERTPQVNHWNEAHIEEFIRSTQSDQLLKCFIHLRAQRIESRDWARAGERRQRWAVGSALFVAALSYLVMWCDDEGIIADSSWFLLVTAVIFFAMVVSIVALKPAIYDARSGVRNRRRPS